MSESESIDQYMAKVMGIANTPRINGEKLVAGILKSKDMSKFLVEGITGFLLSHEARINLDDRSLEHAFKSKVSIDRGKDIGNNIGKGFQGRKGRGR